MDTDASKPGHSDTRAVCNTGHSHWELTVLRRYLKGMCVSEERQWNTSQTTEQTVLTHLLWDEIESVHIDGSSKEPLIQYQHQSDPEWGYELVDHLKKQGNKVDSLWNKE